MGFLKSKVRRITAKWQLYIFLLPGLLFLLFFKLIPLIGIQIGFKEFNPRLGIFGSPWSGLDNFKYLFSYYGIKTIFANTVSLSLYSLLAGFPVPIIIALSLHNLGQSNIRNWIQTLILLPYFVALAISISMFMQFLSPHNGILSDIFSWLKIRPVFFFSDPRAFRHLYVLTEIWQFSGLNVLIYTTALGEINNDLYDTAKIDGSSNIQIIRYIQLPLLFPIMAIVFIIHISRTLSLSTERLLLLQNPLNLSRSEVMTTFIYKNALIEGKYDLAAAAGFIYSIVHLVLIVLIFIGSRKTWKKILW